jgi:hypothetical protein
MEWQSWMAFPTTFHARWMFYRDVPTQTKISSQGVSQILYISPSSINSPRIHWCSGFLTGIWWLPHIAIAVPGDKSCVFGLKTLFWVFGFVKDVAKHTPGRKRPQPAIIFQPYVPAMPGLHAHHREKKAQLRDWSGDAPAQHTSKSSAA